MSRKLFRTILYAISLFMMADSFSALAADKVGIVLMHGKKSSPAHVQALAEDLRTHGYLVSTPEMPWSQSRAYDRSLEDAHREIDTLISKLYKEGATRIVIAGHSMGANIALSYVSTHAGVDAVMALGPGQTVESPRFAAAVGNSVGKAREMVAYGAGDTEAEFTDMHLGKLTTTSTTARIYLSYFDPDGLANMPQTATRVTVPFLWTVGDRDKNMLERGPSYAFERAQPNVQSQYVVVGADHMGTPDASRPVVLGWLDGVFPSRSTETQLGATR